MQQLLDEQTYRQISARAGEGMRQLYALCPSSALALAAEMGAVAMDGIARKHPEIPDDVLAREIAEMTLDLLARRRAQRDTISAQPEMGEQ